MPSNVSPFVMLTPLALLLLGLGQLALWRMWRKHTELAWLSAGLILAGVGVLLQVAWKPNSLLLYVWSFSVFYALAFSCTARALAQRWRVKYSYRLAGAVSVLALAAQWWFSVPHPDLQWRLYVIDAMAISLVAVALLPWRKMHFQNVFDRAMRVVCCVFIASTIVRLQFVLPMSGVTQDFGINESWFWIGVHLVGLLSGMLVAGCMLFAVMRDVIGQMQTERQRDPLTQVLNRRGFEELASMCVREHDEMQSALLICDLDHFKQINDTWGHGAGDNVLQGVASIMQQQVRSSDLVARFGGEEFVVFLNSADARTSMLVAERIRQQVQNQRWEAVPGMRVTISIGIALMCNARTEDFEQAMAQADALLYQAKRSGRNQVMALG